ncbi:MAG: hypothetical protein LC135_16360 [Phycisphaerae bacterium]|jgi:predicted DNA-binding transcriptional regulator AlpA|nr:hypothetical protein [Phycisphaerae bacterium]MCZ2401412.1 hypothetical protein [Phycisphaerae bacterium]
MHEFMTATQVAGRLGISPRHVWKLLASRRLPEPIRMGRVTRWLAGDIDLYIDCRGNMPLFERERPKVPMRVVRGYES